MGFGDRLLLVLLSFDGNLLDGYAGWMEAGIAENALTIYGWAYETDANTPILTSSVPIPAAVRLFGSGSLCLISIARRKN